MFACAEIFIYNYRTKFFSEEVFEMSDKILKKILVVISENFSNGVRADFITETQIRQAYKLRYGDEEIPAAFNVTAFIKKAAFYSGGRYYFVNALNKYRVFRLVDMALNAGNVIVYYEEFFARYRGKFCDWHVKTPDVLEALLRTGDSQLYFGDKYFALNRFVRLGDVIEYVVRTFPTGESFTIDQIREKLPYVPLDEIERTLSYPRKYLKTTNGKYFLAEQVSFDRPEIETMRLLLLRELETNGHAILQMQDFPSTMALNPELGESALRGVLFERFLSKDFSRHGNVLIARGAAVNGTRLLKRFCELQDELTLSELTDRAKKLGINRQISILDAADESMIRVSKTVFVRSTFLKFNTAAIDEALNSFVQGKIIALHDVTSFSTFEPVKDVRGCEWEWNLYLLESFLRKKSRRYKFHASSINPGNGAICPREKLFLSYIDLMSAVVLQEKIPLNETSIGAFLAEKNFRAKRTGGLTTSIIKRAQVVTV